MCSGRPARRSRRTWWSWRSPSPATPGPANASCGSSASAGASNPMVFYVGQLPEASRAPMLTSEQQVLGKEALALRRRRDTTPSAALPCPAPSTARSRRARCIITASKPSQGQRLVISAAARELVPVHRRRRSRLVPTRAGPLRRPGQGGGLQRRLILQPRSADHVQGAQGRRIRVGDQRRDLSRAGGFRLSRDHRSRRRW